MKLRTKFLAFVVILHLITLVLTFLIFQSNKLYFIIAEVFIIISITISWNFYNELIEPLKRLMLGIESIKDRDFNVKFLKTGKIEMDQLIEVYNSMIDELRAERTRQEQQHFFLEKLIATSPTAIIILDFDGCIQSINQRGLDFLKLKETDIISKPIQNVEHALIQKLGNLSAGESMTVVLTGMDMFKIHKTHFIDRGFNRTFIMIEKLTEEILAAEKKVYGKVIRMMAHEVNNSIGPVNSIIGSVLNASQLWQQDSALAFKDALEVAIARNENLNNFTRNLADLVRLPEPVLRDTDFLLLIRSVARLMEIKAKERRIQFVFDFDKTEFVIVADETQMEQVLINIVKNAIEAIGSDGSIMFRLEGKRFVLADTGNALQAEDAPHVFSPFFSTRKEGQGIGLTLVREVLNNHHFAFSLDTNHATKHTEFTIHFSG